MLKLSKELIDDISYQIGLAPSYIEKDWYLVLVLEIIQSFNSEKIKALLAGGTALSKAYKLISRFSEDIDFSIVGLEQASRKERARYRDCLIDAIDDSQILKVDRASVLSRDENRYSTFYINYPKEYTLENSLRHNLKLELSFKPSARPAELREISSFAHAFIPSSRSVELDCITVIETAANKFNALLWRVDIKNRTHPFNHQTNDPALIRHLHDLAAIFPFINKQNDFIALVQTIFEVDKKRGDKTRNLTLPEFIQQTLNKLTSDPEYEREYSQFVTSMSYNLAKELSYEDAIKNYALICHLWI